MKNTYFTPASEAEHRRGCRGEDVPDYCANCYRPYMEHRNGQCLAWRDKVGKCGRESPTGASGVMREGFSPSKGEQNDPGQAQSG